MGLEPLKSSRFNSIVHLIVMFARYKVHKVDNLQDILYTILVV